MKSNVVATARRASLVSTFGVGAIVPTQEDSFMICGLDDWPPTRDKILEPRLAASLGVHEFRNPPSGRKGGDVPAVRFPEWAFCPGCRALGPAHDICRRGTRRCARCTDARPVSPSRFVACCVAGHIEEFPYREWAHETFDVTDWGHALRLVARGHSSALSDLVVECECGARRSMDGAFGSQAFRGIKKCSGRRPWLGDFESSCDEPLRTLQRGSSNVWFATTRSAISIPSLTNRVDVYVREHFDGLSPSIDSTLAASMFQPPSGFTVDDIARGIDRMRNPAAAGERKGERELRAEEYAALVNGLDDDEVSDQFTCEEVDLTGSGVPDVVAQVSRVSRLREVRALTGFSRIVPATEEDPSVGRSPLVKNGRPAWLPAVEVLGEGVFVRLDPDAFDAWAARGTSQSRAGLIQTSQSAVGEYSLAKRLEITPRTIALHTLAHILIDEMALSAGYPAASLRERLYDDDGQAGILIYTATADSAGSLGGLAALSDPERFRATLESAVRGARWCTSDPVCIESHASGVDGMNLAACHACVLLPETSCERFNLGLDRACLVGLPGSPGDGLFEPTFGPFA